MKKIITVFFVILLCACSSKTITPTPATEQITQPTSEQKNQDIDAEKLLVQAELLCSDFQSCPKAEEALVILDKCIEENADFLEAYELRSIALSQLGYYNDALDDMNKVIRYRKKTDPKLSQSYNRRANIHEKLGNKLGANKDMENANKYKIKETKTK